MINRCRAIIIRRMLYKRRKPPWSKDRKGESKKARKREKKKKKFYKKSISCCSINCYLRKPNEPPPTFKWLHGFLTITCTLSWPSSSTHSLQIHCWGSFGPESSAHWAWAPKSALTSLIKLLFTSHWNFLLSSFKEYIYALGMARWVIYQFHNAEI